MLVRDPPTISVLIATYRRPDGLRRLLNALRAQCEERRDQEIIVVNDGSHDTEYAAVYDDFRQAITYKIHHRNLGIVATRNAAIEVATGSYAVFIDDDCEPPPWYLDWLRARLALHPEIDVVAGAIKPGWSRRDLFERVQEAWFLPRVRRVGRYDLFVTANVAIRMSLLRSIGGFRLPSRARAGEDTEISIRLQRAGARSLIDSNWWVAHDVGDTFWSTVKRYRNYGQANALVVMSLGIESLDPPKGFADGPRRGAAAAWSLFFDYLRHASSLFDRRRARLVAAVLATVISTVYFNRYERTLQRSGGPSN